MTLAKRIRDAARLLQEAEISMRAACDVMTGVTEDLNRVDRAFDLGRFWGEVSVAAQSVVGVNHQLISRLADDIEAAELQAATGTRGP